MRIPFFQFCSVLILLSCVSCTEGDNVTNQDIQIEFGIECGWCGGKKFIVINQSEIAYQRIIPCGEMEGTYKSKRALSTNEWLEIERNLDYEVFKSLNYNSCNVCADGCDEIIRITEKEIVHEIRYTPSQDIKGLEELTIILKRLIEEF